jgi:hypothetical protein
MGALLTGRVYLFIKRENLVVVVGAVNPVITAQLRETERKSRRRAC